MTPTPSRQKPRGRHPQQRLTAVHVRAQKRPGRYADGNGLYLYVDPNGAKRWIWRGVVRGRRCDLGIGPVSVVSLAEARAEALRIKTLAWKGEDPRQVRRKARQGIPTFKTAALTVHASHAETFRNAKHAAQWLSSLETYAFPTIGDRPVDDLTSAEVLKVLSPIWTERPETARRVKQRLKAVFDWAKAAGHRSGDNPVDGIKRVLPRHKTAAKHHAALPYREVPAFLRKLREADANPLTKLAFEFAILTATRTSETLGARWDEVDVKERVWTIPGTRMKAGREHRVPLSTRCLEIIEEARPLAGNSPFAFPGRTGRAPLSNMAFLMVLRRNGHADITAHGFRSSFRDWAAEQSSVPSAVVEAALAHVVRNKTEAAYFRSDLLDQRRQLMERWWRFATRSGAQVLPMRA